MPGRFAEIRAFFDLKRKIDGHLQICPVEYLCCVFSTGSRPLQPDKVCVVCRFIYRLTTADSHQRCHLPPLRHRFMMYENIHGTDKRNVCFTFFLFFVFFLFQPGTQCTHRTQRTHFFSSGIPFRDCVPGICTMRKGRDLLPADGVLLVRFLFAACLFRWLRFLSV